VSQQPAEKNMGRPQVRGEKRPGRKEKPIKSERSSRGFRLGQTWEKIQHKKSSAAEKTGLDEGAEVPKKKLGTEWGKKEPG